MGDKLGLNLTPKVGGGGWVGSLLEGLVITFTSHEKVFTYISKMNIEHVHLDGNVAVTCNLHLLINMHFVIRSSSYTKQQTGVRSKVVHVWLALNKQNGEGNGAPLQYSCLKNPMDGEAWWAAVHGVTKSWTRLSDFTFTFHFHALEKEMATHSSVLAWRIPGTGEPGGCRLWSRTESDTTEAP